MKNRIILLSFFALILQFAIAQTTGKLTVRVEGIEKPADGDFFIYLFDDAESFPGNASKAAQSVKLIATKKDMTYTFSNLPHGDYVVMTFQDTNNNGTMDRNLIGFPKEPIGVSNMKRLGKPSFERNKIAFVQSGQQVTITLRNQ
ncbi:MAG: DUF2141 domain-containing protein [Bacteroidota bacterium]